MTIGMSTCAFALASFGFTGAQPGWQPDGPRQHQRHADRDTASMNVQLGPRPYYLVEDMRPSDLKDTLAACSEGPFEVSDFSIGHRGAALQFPEHTKESYMAAARMGAGIIECDVTFTSDLLGLARDGDLLRQLHGVVSS